MTSGDFRLAAETTIEAIRELLQDLGVVAHSRPQFLYGVRVLLNGLRDLANLNLIIADPTWLNCPKAVEAAWSLTHDAKERLSEFSGINPDFLGYISGQIQIVLNAVNERYGAGMYNSCEFEVEQLICTICGLDIRACDHISGRWYNGKQCRARAEGMELIATAMVDNPRDPRCRVWPWQFDESRSVIRHMNVFNHFDIEGKEDGGEVIDVDKLFPRVRTILRQPRTSIRYDVYAYRKIKRSELIKVVRKALAERNETPRPNSRVRIVTIVGYDDDY